MSLGRYFDGLASFFDVPDRLFTRPGSTVVPGPTRSGTGRVSHHRIGRHSLIWADPELESELADFHGRPAAIAFDEMRTVALAAGAELLGHGLEHVLPVDYRRQSRPPEITVLDGHSSKGIKIVQSLLAECSAEDLDEAEFDVDALDPFLVGWVDGGRLSALAGGRPEEFRPGCMDIGVLVHPDVRRIGRGRAVVGAVADEVSRAGHVPLYRCASSHIGSQRLCRSVGFELALELDAFRWPAR